MSIRPSIAVLKISLCLAIIFSAACTIKPSQDPILKKMIAQKMMIDLRYFCADNNLADTCRQPVTALLPPLAKLIADTGIGGVIMFAENLESPAQILELNYALQQAAKKAGHAPLFIAIDQEGGRVVRIPQSLGTSFAGNMAIGATYAKHGDHFARQSGKIMADELMSLGFNVNFAPTVDVNVNPLNPVINVRSYGENPQMVAELGTAQMAAMQNQGLMATLKHFPGHGDTSVDSHTGLPRVEHDLTQIENTDLLPFNYAISHDNPAFIMTAHIQYPELDSTQFTNKEGETSILPATMSRKILTDLLRNKMAFKGLIVTDALDMAGIAHYFDQSDAVVQTFAAGADIALMPLAIRTPKDLKKLPLMINEVAKAVDQGRLDIGELRASAQRIAQTKSQYQINKQYDLPLYQAIEKSQKTLGIGSHRKVEQALADSAVVQIKNNNVLPIDNKTQNIHLSMPDTPKCMAMTLALKTRLPNSTISCNSLAKEHNDADSDELAKADLLIVADITPDQSLAELGGMDDIQSWRQRAPKKHIMATQLAQLKTAKEQGKTTVFISLRAPYNVGLFSDYADLILASFSYNLNKRETLDQYGRLTVQYQGPIYQALADVITGKITATGELPVTIE